MVDGVGGWTREEPIALPQPVRRGWIEEWRGNRPVELRNVFVLSGIVMLQNGHTGRFHHPANGHDSAVTIRLENPHPAIAFKKMIQANSYPQPSRDSQMVRPKT
jgi:hypothetical protein